ncbi:unnamed protein product [Didymodactylos carnosus]|uniref:Uncharacterized protein n=1 Tax=Didymodactylos carnosus TaxID=1234261 RepID=A0A814BK33_9BILA|nr:unnamed protein product [Didymodactylos carnosus]CAF3706106.1 unnamed protein product [Didymodactylos carnosus]
MCFILSLTELVVSALSGRLYSQSQQQQQTPLSATRTKSSYAEKKISNNQEQLIIHFQNLSCRKELHDYSQYAYDLFSNETDQSLSRTAYSLLPTLPSTTVGHNNHSGSNFDLISLIQSLTQ